MSISIIAAMDQNQLIGNEGNLPWNLPADLEYFKETTIFL
ncbi:MAG: dihydrofolate reductase [bacterium]